MGKNSKPLYKQALLYGLIIALIPTIYNVILFVLGLHLDYNYYGEGIGESYTKSRLFLLPTILFVAIYRYQKQNKEDFKIIKYIKLGLWITLFASIGIAAYNIIFRLLIEPDFSTKFYDINRVQIFKDLVDGHLELGIDYDHEDLENHERNNGNLWIVLSANVVLDFVFTIVYTLLISLVMRIKRNIWGSPRGNSSQ